MSASLASRYADEKNDEDEDSDNDGDDEFDRFGDDPYRTAARASSAATAPDDGPSLVDTSVPAWSQLDGRVRFWTDYLRVPLHGKSCVQLPRLHHGVHTFDNAALGEQLFSAQARRSGEYS